jgi:hypothetical protein
MVGSISFTFEIDYDSLTIQELCACVYYGMVAIGRARHFTQCSITTHRTAFK